MAFFINFSRRARSNLRYFRKRDQQIIVDAICVQLSDQPDRPSRRRVLLEENVLAPWELRIGDFRVFYDVDNENGQVVVLAVGHKIHNLLFIEGEEVQL